jgi:hypothetical protein
LRIDNITGWHWQDPRSVAIEQSQINSQLQVDLLQLIRQSMGEIEFTGHLVARIIQNRKRQTSFFDRFQSVLRQHGQDSDQD